MMRSLRWPIGTWLSLLAVTAAAEFHTFRIEELYSNADGTIQYVVLRESASMNGENLWTGHSLTNTAAGIPQAYVFPKDLPGGSCGYYGCTASPTANRSVLVATPGFVALQLVKPDYVMPGNFLTPSGGTVNYAGVDQVSYGALPVDGVNALNRDGMVVANVATNFAGASGSVVGGAAVVTVVEYHHALFDHYFITPVAAEIALLDAQTPPFQDWSRTGFSFQAYVNAGAPAGSVAICRFFNSSFAPKSSHFYAAHGFGCEVTLATFPDWMLEDGQLFNTQLPDGTGACPAGTVPVYRMYNNGMGGAPNHRFVTSLTARQTMLDQGWVAEGAGIGVGLCAPS
jgi:hypothetical protein